VTDEVRAALRTLAAEEGTASEDRSDALDTIDEATAALDDVRAVAAFVSDGGRDRLERAIRRAARSGDVAAAPRGRDALAAIDRCRRAAADHFRSGRGTVLGGEGQGTNR
jgi:hypothetical protein